jgi:branched-chain amino acid transport system ATP-binding protein
VGGTRGLALRVTGLTVRFGGLVALRDVTLDVAPGGIAGLMGPNGAGKTTLFNCVSGALRPADGAVSIGDADVTRWSAPARAKAGLVRTFQNVGLVRNATVLANTLMAQHAMMRTGIMAGIAGLARQEEADMVLRGRDAVTRLGIELYADRRVRDLPHGIHKLVELACALVRSPRVLLLDEPSAGLDPVETRDLAERLAAIQTEEGFTTIVIDHDLRLVRRLAQEITVLSFGQVIARGPWEEVRVDEDVIAAYLGTGREPANRGAP